MADTVDPQGQFDKDYGDLTSAVQQYASELKEMQDAKAYYLSTIIPKLKAIKDVEMIIIYLITSVYQNASSSTDPNADASIFGLFQDKTGLYGTGLKVNSLLTAVHTDLQNIVNSDSSAPDMVFNAAEDLDKILRNLTLPSDPYYQDFQDVLDPTTLANMSSTDMALRQQFFLTNDPLDPFPGDPSKSYNPPENLDPVTNGYTYHFLNGDTSNFYLGSFAQMQQSMKAPGDFDEATEAYQKLTDNLNSDLGMTQTVNSALNEQLNQLTNFVKALMGFYENGLCQPWMKLNNLAIQNQTKAG